MLLVGAACSEVAAQADRAAVEAVARQALDAISERDSTAFMALMLPGARAYSVRDRDVRFRDVTVDAQGLAQDGPMYLERMWDPQVFVDGDLAIVWTRYDFWLDRTFSHCGTDAFQLFRTREGWKIASIAYNVSRDCPVSPLGIPQF